MARTVEDIKAEIERLTKMKKAMEESGTSYSFKQYTPKSRKEAAADKGEPEPEPSDYVQTGNVKLAVDGTVARGLFIRAEAVGYYLKALQAAAQDERVLAAMEREQEARKANS